MKQILLPLLGAALFIIIVGFMSQGLNNKSANKNFYTRELEIGSKTKVKIEIADTVEERKVGLSGRKSLEENGGMLFSFEGKEVTPGFWMKGMLFPLDIIWIKDEKIVKIDKNVPIPEKDEVSPKLYYPPLSVNYVLEVNAGFCDKNNIKVGDTIKI
jgi:uncharacterized membrane protein (UPF0127 family)